MYWFWQGDEAHSADDIDYDYVEGDIDNDGKKENMMMKIWKYENDNADDDVQEAKIGSRARRLNGSRASLW